MGTTASETLSELEAARAKLERDLEELLDRMPEGEVIAQRAKLVGGAAAAVALIGVLVAKRSARTRADRATYHQARLGAQALADAFAETRAAVPVTPVEAPPRVVPTRRGGKRAAVLLGLLGAAAAAVTTAAKLRQAGDEGGDTVTLPGTHHGNGHVPQTVPPG